MNIDDEARWSMAYRYMLGEESGAIAASLGVHRSTVERALRRLGVPKHRPFIRAKGTPEQRFWAKVDRRRRDECWPWLAGKTQDGYGRFGAVGAHRFAYEAVIGPIPEGLHIDHLCRNRGCVNPYHLEPVTKAENTLRGFSPAAEAARKTHCKNGHEFKIFKGRRKCMVCSSASRDRYRARLRARGERVR